MESTKQIPKLQKCYNYFFVVQARKADKGAACLVVQFNLQKIHQR